MKKIYEALDVEGVVKSNVAVGAISDTKHLTTKEYVDAKTAAIPTVTWANLIALGAARKTGDRFNLSDTIYLGYIILASDDTFNFTDTDGLVEIVKII